MKPEPDISIVFRPAKPGLEKFFGKLETLLMEITWAHHPLTVKRALYFLNKNNNYAYTTVMTVMNRLTDKNYLTRKKAGHSFRYSPTLGKKEFLEFAADKIISELKLDFGDISAPSTSRTKKKRRPGK